jgi:hypothetical protein
LSLVIEAGDGVRGGAVESVGIGEGAVGEIMLLPLTIDTNWCIR